MNEGIYFGESPENLRRKEILQSAAREQIAAVNRDKNQKIKEVESLREELLLDAEKDVPEGKPRDYPSAIKINRIKYDTAKKVLKIEGQAKKSIDDIERELTSKLKELDNPPRGDHREEAKRLDDETADAQITKELNEFGKRNRL